MTAVLTVAVVSCMLLGAVLVIGAVISFAYRLFR
jgi:hypothetical protein